MPNPRRVGFTEAEYAWIQEQAASAKLSLPAWIRSRCDGGSWEGRLRAVSAEGPLSCELPMRFGSDLEAKIQKVRGGIPFRGWVREVCLRVGESYSVLDGAPVQAEQKTPAADPPTDG